MQAAESPLAPETQVGGERQSLDQASLERQSLERLSMERPLGDIPVVERPALDRTPNDGSLYRPPRGDLDPHGRSVPRGQSLADTDELEIPAFLRRHSR